MTAAHDRDRSVVRRGVGAGAVVWAVSAVALLATTGVGGRSAAIGVMLGFAPGVVVTAGWLLLAGLLDLLADYRLGARRLLWTFATLALALLAPMLALAAVGQVGS